MAEIHGPKIVRDGLVLNLDAADRNSYPGSGTTWNDLSGNSNNGTLTNGPTFNAGDKGSIVFDGSNDFIQTSTSIGASITGDFTFSIWAIRDGDSTSSIGGLIGNLWHTEFTGANIYLRNDNTRIDVQTADGTTRTSYVLTSPVSNRNWTNYTLVNIGGLVSTYVNGMLLDSRNRVISPSLTKQVTIGKWAGSFSSYILNGKIAATQVYVVGLTSTQVLQNYNATKTRFNLS
jgi:hypothetical protein